jgi:fibro-slime domain-containing protein
LDSDGTHRLRVASTVTVIQSKDSFAQWYKDSAYSTATLGTIELTAKANGLFQFSSSSTSTGSTTGGRTIYDDLHDVCLAENRSGTLSAGFFPLEGTSRTKVCNIWPYWLSGLATNCCAGSGCPVLSQWDPIAAYDNCPASGTGGPVPNSSGTGGRITGSMRNFFFTSEVHYLYRYDGTTQQLGFFGDDDVWVFINGHLALDLGATHERIAGTVAIGADYGLSAGKVYEIAVFHAQRHPRESNYQLTLPASKITRSSCTSRCGDGIVTAGEECDLGALNNDDQYGGCTTSCKYGPFCGDAEVTGPEECDDGTNSNLSPTNTACGPGCKIVLN